MLKKTRDILSISSNFAIEKMTLSPNVSMNLSHAHNHYEILYVNSGERILILNNSQRYILNRHSIAVIPPNVIHRTISNSNSIHTRILVNISAELMDEIVTFSSLAILSCFNACVINLDNSDIGIMQYFLNILLETNKDDTLFPEKTRIVLANLLLHINMCYINHSYNPSSNIPQLHDTIKRNIEFVSEYIKTNYSVDISNSSLAELIHANEDYFIKCFKQYFSITPMKYLNNVRIINAKRFLEDKSVSVSDVSKLCGYNSNSSFTRAFKKTIGITPKEYQLYYINKSNESNE